MTLIDNTKKKSVMQQTRLEFHLYLEIFRFKKFVWNSKPFLVSFNEEIIASKYILRHFLCYKIVDDDMDDVWETRWKIQTEIWIGKN